MVNNAVRKYRACGASNCCGEEVAGEKSPERKLLPYHISAVKP